jgi:hypothetical protein
LIQGKDKKKREEKNKRREEEKEKEKNRKVYKKKMEPKTCFGHNMSIST